MKPILLTILAATALVAQEPPTQAVGSMSQLMIDIIYPASNALFYITRGAPQNEAGWMDLQSKALTLAESGNLLMMKGRAYDQDGWMKDAKLLVDVGAAAYKAAKAKDAPAIVALSEQLNTSCVQCHQDYRPNFRRREKQ